MGRQIKEGIKSGEGSKEHLEVTLVHGDKSELTSSFVRIQNEERIHRELLRQSGSSDRDVLKIY